MATALITGATAGIGNAFARKLAAEGFGLVLVARDAERLGLTGAALHARSGVDTEVIAADLTDREQLERVADRLRDGARPVDVLVNNAGFALNRGFLHSDVADEERFLDVMVRAVLVLTKAAVPGMTERGRGRVITVSSVAGFLPSGTYSAAKAWATTFTASLAGELAGTGVTATALCPGYVRTEFHQRAQLEMSMIPSWAWLDADRLVAEAWADAKRGTAVSIPSRRYKVAAAGLRHLPLRAVQIMGRRRAARRSAAGDRGRTAPPAAGPPAGR
jgi:short-subunit dehydrogenase